MPDCSDKSSFTAVMRLPVAVSVKALTRSREKPSCKARFERGAVPALVGLLKRAARDITAELHSRRMLMLWKRFLGKRSRLTPVVRSNRPIR